MMPCGKPRSRRDLPQQPHFHCLLDYILLLTRSSTARACPRCCLSGPAACFSLCMDMLLLLGDLLAPVLRCG